MLAVRRYAAFCYTPSPGGGVLTGCVGAVPRKGTFAEEVTT
jgi:hypothetical protein